MDPGSGERLSISYWLIVASGGITDSSQHIVPSEVLFHSLFSGRELPPKMAK